MFRTVRSNQRSGERDAAGPAGSAPKEARLPSFVFAPAGATPAKRLAALRLAIVGCGGVGRYFAETTARLGPASVELVDDGIYEIENMNNQSIRPEEVGRRKAASTASVLKSINPATEVSYFDRPVEQLPVTAFCDRNLVFLATDNLAAEKDTSSRCVRHGVPLLQGAVYGDQLIAQVRLWRHRHDGDACLVCGYGAEEFRHLSQNTRWTCAGAIAGEGPVSTTAPTMSVAGQSALAANLAMMQMLRLVMELGKPLEDSILQYCGYTNEIVSSPLGRNPACPANHRRWGRAVTRELPGRTLREIVKAADMADEALSIELDGHAFVAEASCSCADRTQVRRFTAGHGTVGHCERCGKSLRTVALERYDAAPMTVLQPVLDRPVREIGAPDVRGAVVRNADREVLVVDEATGCAAVAHARREQP